MSKKHGTSYKDYDPLSPRDAWKFNAKPFRWAFALTRPVKGQVYGAFIGMILNTALAIAPGLLAGRIIDEVFTKRDFTNFWTYVILIFLVPVIRSLIMFVRRLFYETISQHVFIRVRDALYQHLQKLDQDYYSATPTGRIMARLTGDLEMVRYFFAWGGFATIETILYFVFGVVYLFTVQWKLALTTLLVSPLLTISAVALLKDIKPVWTNIRQQFERLNQVVQQNINGNRATKAFVRNEFEIEKFEVENEQYAELNKTGADVRAKHIPIMDALSSLMNLPVILIGGTLVIKGQMSLGELVVFNSLIYMIVFPMNVLGFRIDDLQHYASSANKIIEMLQVKTKVASPLETDITDNPQEADKELVRASKESPALMAAKAQEGEAVEDDLETILDPEADEEAKTISRLRLTETAENVQKALPKEKGRRGYIPDKPFPMSAYTNKANRKNAATKVDKLVEELLEREDIPRIKLEGDVIFENVSYDYSLHGQKVPALRNISFHAWPGQTIGIIGETGSGKTTLVELISRMADPSEGRILIDGRDLKTYPLEALRRSIHVVTQDVFLFSDSVESNIAFSDPSMPLDEVYNSAEIAVAADFINKMEDGYDTIIGEEGVGLSGGQRQRVSLARAVAGKPDILILDDTTSAVDMNTDAKIRKNLRENLQGKTVFFIGQRISSVRNSDQILVMKDGQIAESGTHEELIKLNGIYADIYDTQLGDSEESLKVLLESKQLPNSIAGQNLAGQAEQLTSDNKSDSNKKEITTENTEKGE